MSCEVINPTAALPELGTRIRHMITTGRRVVEVGFFKHKAKRKTTYDTLS